jgi:hypothetical protein
VNKRPSTWFLAALIAFCASQAMPSSQVQSTPQNCAIIWIARARVRQRVSIEQRAGYRRASILVVKPEKQHYTRLFSKPLYQRPPPFSFL